MLENSEDLSDEKLFRAKLDIAEAGFQLTESFFKRNKDVVIESLHTEIDNLAENIGFATALGINLADSVHPKDAYGGTIADLDVMEIGKESTSSQLDKALSNAIANVIRLTALHGLDQETQKQMLIRFINNTSTEFQYTLQNIDRLRLTDAYYNQLKKYYKEISDVYNVTLETSGNSLLRLLYCDNAEILDTVYACQIDRGYNYEIVYKSRPLIPTMGIESKIPNSYKGSKREDDNLVTIKLKSPL